MKGNILFGALLVILLAIAYSFNTSGVSVSVDKTGTTEVVHSAFAPGIQYSKTFSTITTTNAKQDTLLFTSPLTTLTSAFQYNYVIQRTNVSGTTAVSFILQESNESTGTANWYVVATAGTTGATTDKIQGAVLYGKRHRLIVSGSGTQVTTCIVSANLKQTN